MLVLERILAIPDQSVDYLQCGIAGKERAALAARGFIRKDGTKAKDYMIRTIQKTEKNKAKTEKAVIKGDKKLSALEQFQKTQPFVNALTDGESIVAVTPKGRKLEISYNKKDGYIRPHAVIKNLDNPSQEVVKNPMTKDQLHTYIANFEDVKIKPQSAKKIAVTYNKKGDLSEGSAAKKIKGAIARSKADKPEKMTAWQKEYSDKYKAIKSDQKPTQAIVRTYSVSNGDGKGSAVEITFDKDFASDKKLKPILTAYAKDSLLGQVVEHPAPNVLRIRNPDTEVLNKDGKHQYVAKSLAKLGMSVKSDQLIGDKASPVVSTASATPKSRKVVKGMRPRDRGIPPAASQFIKESSKNHTVFYNGKAVSMDYLGKKPKDEFKFAGMRIADNLSTGGVGFIKTPKGEYYQVSSANRSAKKVSKKEVLDSVRQSKPKQEPTRAQKLGMTEAEYEAFKKKVARL